MRAGPCAAGRLRSSAAAGSWSRAASSRPVAAAASSCPAPSPTRRGRSIGCRRKSSVCGGFQPNRCFEECRMTAGAKRHLKVAAAQLGAIHRADSRESVVKRLMAMMREAHSSGARFIVFPELALTTFFPRLWMECQTEIDRYFEAQMPSPATVPLFQLGRELGVGFYLGYAELTEEEGATKRYNTSILLA